MTDKDVITAVLMFLAGTGCLAAMIVHLMDGNNALAAVFAVLAIIVGVAGIRLALRKLREPDSDRKGDAHGEAQRPPDR